MSSQNKQHDPKSKNDFIVISLGPINIAGALKRKDDHVALTDAQAKTYAAHVQRVSDTKEPAKNDTTLAKSSASKAKS